MGFTRSLIADSLLLCAAVLALCMQARANDDMFPALPAAANSIGWQGNDQPGMQIRKMYSPYISEVDVECARILPILAKHQINKGGTFNSVVGENEIAILAWHDGLDTFSIGTPKPDPFAGIFGGVTKDNGEPLATSWRFRGGLGGMVESALIGRVTNWKTFMDGSWSGSAGEKRPSFCMTSFKSFLQAGAFVTVGRSTEGLSSGSVWVNGHNIGRFSGDSLLYIPEGWLTTDNILVIYDESENLPSDVHFQYSKRAPVTRARFAKHNEQHDHLRRTEQTVIQAISVTALGFQPQFQVVED